MLGGNLKRMIIGSAPIKAEVLDFIKITFGFNINEGYGMTESTAGFSATLLEDKFSGHIGYVNPYMATKLKEHPDLGYSCQDTPNN